MNRPTHPRNSRGVPEIDCVTSHALHDTPRMESVFHMSWNNMPPQKDAPWHHLFLKAVLWQSRICITGRPGSKNLGPHQHANVAFWRPRSMWAIGYACGCAKFARRGRGASTWSWIPIRRPETAPTAPERRLDLGAHGLGDLKLSQGRVDGSVSHRASAIDRKVGF